MSKWTKWIPHEGDVCPVAKDEIVRVKFRQNRTSSKQDRTNEAGQWIWDVFRFSDDITHYKRLKKNVEAEEAKKTKAAAEKSWTEANERGNDEYAFKLSQAAIAEDLSTLKDRPETRRGPYVITDEDVDAATPKPIITGPGEYVTRKGEKAFVDHLGFNTPWPATGFIDGVGLRWNQWGDPIDHNLDHHITGPWQEAEKPERWKPLYASPYRGYCLGGTVYASMDEARTCGAIRPGDYKMVGVVLLNPEEEG